MVLGSYGERLRQVPHGATGPAVGSIALHNHKDRPAAISQCIRNVQKAFAGHCHLEDKIPGGNACFTHRGGDIHNSKIAPPPQPVLNDNYGHPISSDLRLAGSHILRLETERLRHLNASSKKLSFFS